MAAGDITIIEEETFGTQTIIIGTFELPAVAYTAAGIAPGTAKFGLTTVNFCSMEPVETEADMSKAVYPKYDRAADLVILYESASGVSAPMDYSNVDPVANVTDVRFMAIGRK